MADFDLLYELLSAAVFFSGEPLETFAYDLRQGTPISTPFFFYV